VLSVIHLIEQKEIKIALGGTEGSGLAI